MKKFLLLLGLTGSLLANSHSIMNEFTADYINSCSKAMVKDTSIKNPKEICECSLNAVTSIYNNSDVLKKLQYGVGKDIEFSIDFSFSKLVDETIDNCIIARQILK